MSIELYDRSESNDELAALIAAKIVRGVIAPEDAAKNVVDDGPMYVFHTLEGLRSLMQRTGAVIAESGSDAACNFLAVCYDALGVLEAAFPGQQLSFDQVSACAEAWLGLDAATTLMAGEQLVNNAPPALDPREQALVEGQFVVWDAFEAAAEPTV